MDLTFETRSSIIVSLYFFGQVFKGPMRYYPKQIGCHQKNVSFSEPVFSILESFSEPDWIDLHQLLDVLLPWKLFRRFGLFIKMNNY